MGESIQRNSLDMTPIFGDIYGANCDAPEQLGDTSVLVHVFLRGGLARETGIGEAERSGRGSRGP